MYRAKLLPLHIDKTIFSDKNIIQICEGITTGAHSISPNVMFRLELRLYQLNRMENSILNFSSALTEDCENGGLNTEKQC